MVRCARFLPLLALPLITALVEQPLASSPSNVWTLANANASLRINATVPGCVHLDLLRAGLIGEPYAGGNVDAQAWVKNEPFWEWTLAFEPTAALLASAEQELVAEGIDAVADVALNGARLWSQASAFVRTVVSVRGALRAGRNALVVRVYSPTRAALASNASCAGFCPPAAWGPAANRSAYDQAFMYVRKPACDLGWDFAPNFAPSGVTGRLSLRGFAGAVLEDVAVAAAPAALPVPLDGAAAWTLTVSALVAVRAPPGATVALTVAVAVVGLPGGAGSARATLGAGDAAVPVTLAVPAAAAWWPRGLGEPTLYNATVTVAVDGAGEAGASALPVAVAFRTVAVRRPSMGDGALMYFEANGHALFLKGANWVPPDAFIERAARPAQLAPKIAALAAAGFNGVRVWGGGRPMPDAFYELAQAAGLLVWHELPYACALYPTGAALLAGAAAEATAIVRRLQKFSVVLWGGNNEIAQINAEKGLLDPGSPGAGNYSELFFGALAPAVAAADATRAYVPTSPGSGTETAAAPVASPPQGPAAGDMHVYNYTSNCLDPRQYPRARAASEFGWQSYPSFLSMAELMGPRFFDYWSASVQRRDTHASQPPATILFHNVGQNWLIPGYNGSGGSAPGARDARLAGAALAAAAVARAAGATSAAYTPRADGTFALPTDALGIVPMMSALGGGGAARGTVFRDTLFLTQISHAACLRTEAESYRRGQSSCAADGVGCTSTILYWMANELWPAATKASIEWSGRWKATHYEAARGFLAPLLLSAWAAPLAPGTPAAAVPFGISLAAHAPDARRGAVPAGTLRLSCWAWADGHLGDADAPVRVPAWPTAWGAARDTAAAGGAVELASSTLADALAACGCGAPRAPAECVLTAAVFNTSAPGAGAVPLARTWLLPVPPRAITTMRDPQLRVTAVAAVAGAPGAFEVTLEAAALPVANVWLETLLCCGHFADNNFLMTESPLVVGFVPGADARGWAHAPPPGAERSVTPGQFAASLSVASLFDTVAGYSAGAARADA
jgi:hypothetical protein